VAEVSNAAELSVCEDARVSVETWGFWFTIESSDEIDLDQRQGAD
jgi:hypothetical protein